MKKITKVCVALIIAASSLAAPSIAQDFDQERMKRDIEVAENILATLIKHEFDQGKVLFGIDVRGTYQPGYGVTFRVPTNHWMPMVVTITGDDSERATVISEGNSYRYSYRTNGVTTGDDDEAQAVKLKDKTKEKSKITEDSARAGYNDRIIGAAQNFILDYGDVISQLSANERIVVTNQDDRAHFYFPAGKRTRISVEGARGDVTSFRQGKLSRDQALKKLSIVNTESVEAREPDMEMLSSIFSRLYRPDLSKTYFLEGNVYYERLKDFGAIFYLRVLSSEERAPNRFTLPTAGLENVDQSTRDKKVTDLYPIFEEDIKENMLEYGRTVKSLNDDENLIFNISLTKCKGCGIPSTLELSIKGSVLKDFATGRVDKKSAKNKIVVKKGPGQ